MHIDSQAKKKMAFKHNTQILPSKLRMEKLGQSFTTLFVSFILLFRIFAIQYKVFTKLQNHDSKTGIRNHVPKIIRRRIVKKLVNLGVKLHANNITHTQHSPTYCFLCIQGETNFSRSTIQSKNAHCISTTKELLSVHIFCQ